MRERGQTSFSKSSSFKGKQKNKTLQQVNEYTVQMIWHEYILQENTILVFLLQNFTFNSELVDVDLLAISEWKLLDLYTSFIQTLKQAEI